MACCSRRGRGSGRVALLHLAQRAVEHVLHHSLDGAHDLSLGGEADLEVDLRELRLAVGAAALVAEAARDLEVARHPAYHQHLLVLLRRLRQGVEPAGGARRDEELGCALGRRLEQGRRLDLGEAAALHQVPPRRVRHGRAQRQQVLRPRTTQVDVAVLQAQHVSGRSGAAERRAAGRCARGRSGQRRGALVLQRDGLRLGDVEQLEGVERELAVPGRALQRVGLGGGTRAHGPLGPDHALQRQARQQAEQARRVRTRSLRRRARPLQLHHARVVAQHAEPHAAHRARRLQPPAQRHGGRGSWRGGFARCSDREHCGRRACVRARGHRQRGEGDGRENRRRRSGGRGRGGGGGRRRGGRGGGGRAGERSHQGGCCAAAAMRCWCNGERVSRSLRVRPCGRLQARGSYGCCSGQSSASCRRVPHSSVVFVCVCVC